VIVISHRPATLNSVDKIVVIQTGMVRLFGTRNEVLAKLGQPVPAPVASLARERAARQAAGV